MSNVSIALKIFSGVKYVIMSTLARGDLTSVSTVENIIHSMGMFHVITGQCVSFSQFLVQMDVLSVSLDNTCMNTLCSAVP